MGSLRLDRESPSVDGSYELPECAMELIEMMRDVVEQSGLAALWQQVAPRLALDLRQLIFVAAGSTAAFATTRTAWIAPEWQRSEPETITTRDAPSPR